MQKKKIQNKNTEKTDLKKEQQKETKTEDKNDNKDSDKKYVELGTEHCILKKIFKTAYRINSNLLKEFN